LKKESGPLTSATIRLLLPKWKAPRWESNR